MQGCDDQGCLADQIGAYHISSSHTRLIRCLTLLWVHLSKHMLISMVSRSSVVSIAKINA